MDRKRNYPIETFDPLLRDLVAWDLVVHIETAAGCSWRLTDAVESRLTEIVSRARFASGEQLVYLNHRCGDCRLRGLTRLVEGAYLCDACFDRRTAGTVKAEGVPTRGTEWKRWRRRTNTAHESRPLAGRSAGAAKWNDKNKEEAR
jgi:ribosomal protein L37AE/L43A